MLRIAGSPGRTCAGLKWFDRDHDRNQRPENLSDDVTLPERRVGDGRGKAQPGQIQEREIELAVVLARQAGEQGFPTMGFDVKSGTDFSGSIDEDGVRVYMGLYLVDQHPDEVDPYHLEDRLLLAHEAFPIEYNPQTEEFDLTPLKGGGATRLRLNKTLNKMEPLKMSPGKWIVRIVSTTGRGSIRSDSDHAFELAPGKNYSLGIRWQSNRGVRTLQFDLREN